MGLMKEYHVWDANFIEGFEGRQRSALGLKRPREKLRFKLQSEEGAYEEYFRSLVSDKKPITGDITPSYSGLTSEQLSVIKSRLEQKGFKVKVVFLMRDPVQRCWSATQMLLNRNIVKTGNIPSQSAANACFKSHFKTQFSIYRTAYDKTVESVGAAFDSDDIYYGIFEEMFHDGSIKAISSFLGLKENIAFREERVNANNAKLTLDEASAQACRRFYDYVYAFCYDRFPQTRDLWTPEK
jgi:hypothetical protein